MSCFFGSPWGCTSCPHGPAPAVPGAQISGDVKSPSSPESCRRSGSGTSSRASKVSVMRMLSPAALRSSAWQCRAKVLPMRRKFQHVPAAAQKHQELKLWIKITVQTQITRTIVMFKSMTWARKSSKHSNFQYLAMTLTLTYFLTFSTTCHVHGTFTARFPPCCRARRPSLARQLGSAAASSSAASTAAASSSSRRAATKSTVSPLARQALTSTASGLVRRTTLNHLAHHGCHFPWILKDSDTTTYPQTRETPPKAVFPVF